jgi:hypothetical protein
MIDYAYQHWAKNAHVSRAAQAADLLICVHRASGHKYRRRLSVRSSVRQTVLTASPGTCLRHTCSAQASRSRPLRSYSSCRTAPRPPRSRVSYHIQTHAHTSAQIESAPARVYMHACTHLMISILFDCESAGSIFTVREKQFGSQLHSVRAD